MLDNNESDLKWREAYVSALEACIGALIAMRDKAGLTWDDRLRASADIQRLLPHLVRACMYFRNTKEMVQIENPPPKA